MHSDSLWEPDFIADMITSQSLVDRRIVSFLQFLVGFGYGVHNSLE